MMLSSRLITAFKTMKVVACCVGNRACHVSPEEFISLDKCTPVFHTVLTGLISSASWKGAYRSFTAFTVQCIKEVWQVSFQTMNPWVEQTAEGYIYKVGISIYSIIRHRWFMTENRTQTLRQGVILSQVVSVPSVWLHKSLPGALLYGSYFPALV